MASRREFPVPVGRSEFINNSPHFFKVVPAPVSQGLKIPITFMHKYGDSLKNSSAVVLKALNGAPCRVQLRHTETGTWLGQGWEQFSSYYDIKSCDFLVFNYAGNSQFHVKIFGEKLSCKTLDPEPAIGNMNIPKKDFELELPSSSESSDESDVEIYEPPVRNPKKESGIRNLKRKLKVESSSSESSDEDDVDIYEPPGQRKADKMQKDKMKMNLESEEKVIRNPKRKLELESSSSESSKEDYEPVPRKANKMQKNKMKEKLEPEKDDGVEITEPKKPGMGRKGSKMVAHNKKKEYLSYKRAEAFTSENPFFLVFMQPSYVSNRYILNLNLASAGAVLPKNAQSCMLRVRVPGRHGRVWELSCSFYWKRKIANVSMGWKSFAVDNKLRVGDVCIFESVERNLVDFNITIFRRNG